MSDVSQGPGWWLASDGKWYPPEAMATRAPTVTPPPGVWVQQGQGGVPYAAQRSTNGLSVAALVLGIVWLGGIGSVLALIFGLVARRQIRGSGGRQSGSGMATAGIVLGIVGIVGAILWIVAVAVAVHNVDTCLNNLNAPNCGGLTNTGNSGTLLGFNLSGLL